MSIEKFSPLSDRLDLGEARRAEYGPIWLDLKSRTLHCAGTDESVQLVPQEYQVLWLLVRAQGNLVSETDIRRFLFDDDEKEDPMSNVVAKRTQTARAKLKSLTNNKVSIENLESMGYYLKLDN